MVFPVQRKTFLRSLCFFFSNNFFSYTFLWTRFLENGSADFCEHFEISRYWSDPYRSFCIDDVISVFAILMFYRFLEGRPVLGFSSKGIKRYRVQICRKYRPKIVDVSEAFSLFCDKKSDARLNSTYRKKTASWFSMVFFEYLQIILLKIIKHNNFIKSRVFVWYQEKVTCLSN